MARLAIVAATLIVGLLGTVAQVVVGLEADDWLVIPAATALVVVGSVLVLRVPSNSVSWTMLLLALGFGIVGLAEALASTELYQAVSGFVIFGLLLPGLGVWIPLSFPTGRPPSSRWDWVRLVMWLGIVLIFAGFGWAAIESAELSANVGCESPGTCISVIGLYMLLGAAIAAVVSFVLRWRRSAGVEREQLRWLVPPFLILIVGVLAEFGGAQDTIVADVLLPLGLFLVPVAIGIAITRYRLYEIDRIISRTISYSIVVGLLVAFVALVATLVSTRFDDPLVVAATTLGVAAAFNPLRKWVQRWVDRRFNRSRYDAERVMDEFAGSLRTRTDEVQVLEGWVGVVSQTMHPSSVGVWMKE